MHQGKGISPAFAIWQHFSLNNNFYSKLNLTPFYDKKLLRSEQGNITEHCFPWLSCYRAQCWVEVERGGLFSGHGWKNLWAQKPVVPTVPWLSRLCKWTKKEICSKPLHSKTVAIGVLASIVRAIKSKPLTPFQLTVNVLWCLLHLSLLPTLWAVRFSVKLI